MSQFVHEARSFLPDTATDGVLTGVPIEKQTGKLSVDANPGDEENYIFYKFLRSYGEWIYLGFGKVSDVHKPLFTALADLLYLHAQTLKSICEGGDRSTLE